MLAHVTLGVLGLIPGKIHRHPPRCFFYEKQALWVGESVVSLWERACLCVPDIKLLIKYLSCPSGSSEGLLGHCWACICVSPPALRSGPPKGSNVLARKADFSQNQHQVEHRRRGGRGCSRAVLGRGEHIMRGHQESDWLALSEPYTAIAATSGHRAVRTQISIFVWSHKEGGGGLKHPFAPPPCLHP